MNCGDMNYEFPSSSSATPKMRMLFLLDRDSRAVPVGFFAVLDSYIEPFSPLPPSPPPSPHKTPVLQLSQTGPVFPSQGCPVCL